MNFKLQKNMLLGVATSATQIEGGDNANSWYDWALRSGNIKDGTNPLRADDHYNRVSEDIALMTDLNIKTYRLSIEWSRIQPEQSIFNAKAINHYKNELELLHKAGIKPLVTLHHFTNPRWFEQMGAFEHPDSPQIFINYVRYVVEALADVVEEWVTINEPNVYAVQGYVYGVWPPGKKNQIKKVSTVYTNLALSHIIAYKEIHRIRTQKGFDSSTTRVGFANNLHIFTPKCAWNPLHHISAAIMKKAYQDSITDAFMVGKSAWPLKKFPNKIGDIAIIEGRYYDFIGINYYNRDAVSCFKVEVFKNVPHNNLGWEIYPQGILTLVKKQYQKYMAPIYITENGTCDKLDTFRSRFIYDHLKLLCQSNVPVERYYHWSLLDNFEWAEGEDPRFGLIDVDYETQKRTIRESGKFYAEIINEGGVTQQMYDTYVKNSVYEKSEK